MNSYYHFLGNHTSCPNGNENFHSVKSRYVSKNVNIRNSLFGRISCSILQYNHPLQLILLISKHFGCQNALPEYLYKMNPIQKKNKKTEKKTILKEQENDAAKNELAHK